MNISYNNENFSQYEPSEERVRPGIGLGGFGSGLGFFPGAGFGRPGFGRPGFGGRSFGFGFPFLTGFTAGALLTPRIPYAYPYPYSYSYYYPYPPYPYPYPPYPYY